MKYNFHPCFRLVLASEPGPPESPEIIDASDTEVLLKWKQPKDDGNTPVLCYGLQYQENGNGIPVPILSSVPWPILKRDQGPTMTKDMA